MWIAINREFWGGSVIAEPEPIGGAREGNQVHGICGSKVAAVLSSNISVHQHSDRVADATVLRGEKLYMLI